LPLTKLVTEGDWQGVLAIGSPHHVDRPISTIQIVKGGHRFVKHGMDLTRPISH
jgi:hypothetical protein